MAVRCGSTPRIESVPTPVALTARTEHFDGAAALAYVDPRSPLAFLRGDEGIVGYGETLRLAFSGESRFRDAADAWARLLEAATVHDDVQLPGTGLVAFGAFAFDAHSRAESVLIVPQVVIGEAEGRRWVTRITLDEEDSSASLAELLNATEIDEMRVDFQHGRISSAAYEGAVVGALEQIRTGEVSKLVIARDLEGRLPAEGDLRSVILGLRRRYPTAMAYAVDGLIGASPETLVRVRGGEFFTRVLAGTAGRGATKQLDAEAAATLAASGKNTREHALAVESAMVSLRSVGVAPQAGEAFTLQLPNLWHLATDITGTLDGATVFEAVEALHPTAAVGGTPTAEALPRIRRIEGIDRMRYAGPVGWLDSTGNATWAIALRGSEVAANGTIRAFAGAGIVEGSDPAAELRETEIKFRPIRDAFADPLPE